jgi:hypothetical protein
VRRSNSEVERSKRRVLEAIRQGRTVADAVASEGVTIKAWKGWRSRDPLFRVQADEALGRKPVVVTDSPLLLAASGGVSVRYVAPEPEPQPTRHRGCRRCGGPVVLMGRGLRCLNVKACGVTLPS